MRAWPHVIAAACVCTVAPAAAQPTGVLNLICSVNTEWCDFVASTFSSASGVQVVMVKRSSGEALAQLIAEKQEPRADVWFGGTGDPHLQAAELDLTLPYLSPRLADLHDWARAQAVQSGGRAVGVYSGFLGLAYNTAQFAQRKLPAPACWKDLLRPALKGRIQLAHPASSGTAYTMLATLVQLMGEEAAFGYMQALHRNVAQYTRSGSAPLKAVSRGDAMVAVSFMHDVPGARLEGAPVAAQAPCEGTGAEIGSMSIVRGARHLDAAKAFHDWALAPLTQQFAAVLRQYQVPSNKAVLLDPRVPDTRQVKLVDYDHARFGNAAERQRLIARWERDVFAASR